MSSPSAAMPESSPGSRLSAPKIITEAQRFYWSLQRELWENRSLYIAPLVVAALVLLGSLISAIRLPATMRAAAALSPMQQAKALQEPYYFAALLLMGTTFVVAIIYCLDALYGERRDRSILFWKSLPVSDFTIVVSKASIPIVVLPLLTFAIAVVTQWIMLLMSSAVLAGSAGSVATLWSQVSPVRMSLGELFHLVAMHGFWYAPIYCWLLLVSAWAKRVPILWAALPLAAIGVVEKIAFNSATFLSMVGQRIASPDDGSATGSMAMDHFSRTTLVQFLSSPGLWIGLALAAAFLAAAMRIRHYREPI
jgi:ABC-2 type transport system permease protein